MEKGKAVVEKKTKVELIKPIPNLAYFEGDVIEVSPEKAKEYKAKGFIK